MTKEERTEALLESAKNADELETIIADYITQNKVSYKDLVFTLEKIKFMQLDDLVNGDDEE
ncbi:MAG: hypothetical protein IPJ03_16250 [Ignavibacteriales bacterium]|nr:hypothetical protein [Ignavibacteriales bacterium]